MEPDAYTGDGGATEGDVRGSHSDMIDAGSVVDLDGGHCLVHEATSPAMTVVVDAGVVYVPNTSFDETDSDSIKYWEAVVAGTTGSRTLVIGANSSGSTRVDLVCVYLDPGATPDENASDVAELLIVAGTPGAGAPATPSYHALLATVTVANGATSIVNANITDSRTQIQLKNAFIPDKLEDKRRKRRVRSLTTTSTLTANIDNEDMLVVTALAGALTIAAPTGTPDDGDVLIYRFKDNGTARALTWNSVFRVISTYLPDTTVLSKVVYSVCIWNAQDSKWDVLTTQQE
jgi:hypothetical protein